MQIYHKFARLLFLSLEGRRPAECCACIVVRGSSAAERLTLSWPEGLHLFGGSICVILNLYVKGTCFKAHGHSFLRQCTTTGVRKAYLLYAVCSC